MSDIALGGNHDLDLTDQEMHLVEDEPGLPNAVGQEVSIALQFFRKEWPLNVLVGIPYHEQVFIKNPSLPALTVMFTRAALSIPGIVETRQMKLAFDNSGRRLTITPKLRAEDGTPVDVGQLAVVL